ncbi:MAG: response regulator transcription factor [Syntrophomonas sp.]|nr:response regulator transcription factor [Syntrophomonas sp.]
MRILVIEDEPSLLKIITKRLKEEGYNVDASNNGEEGQYFSEIIDYDCIVLDIMLPVIDGLSVLKNLRAKRVMTPVLLLTARDSIDDRVKGLDAGADDYLVKPFSFDELLARIRSLLRRNADTRDNILCISDLTLDINSHNVIRNGLSIELTTKEYAILEYLMRNKERIITRTQIVEHVWNYDFDCNSNIVDVYIRYLRRKIDDSFGTKLIHTVRGSGYVLKEKI